jgi:hypothetical protein
MFYVQNSWNIPTGWTQTLYRQIAFVILIIRTELLVNKLDDLNNCIYFLLNSKYIALQRNLHYQNFKVIFLFQ